MKEYVTFKNGLSVLESANEQDLYNTFIVSGINHKFFAQVYFLLYLLKRLLIYEGFGRVDYSPKETMKEAYQCYDFINEKIWLEILNCYKERRSFRDDAAARELSTKIITAYIPEMKKLLGGIDDEYGDILNKID